MWKKSDFTHFLSQKFREHNCASINLNFLFLAALSSSRNLNVGWLVILLVDLCEEITYRVLNGIKTYLKPTYLHTYLCHSNDGSDISESSDKSDRSNKQKFVTFFHQLGPLGRVDLVDTISVCCRLLVCPLPMRFFFCVVGLVQIVPCPWTGAISISILSRSLKTRMCSEVRSQS